MDIGALIFIPLGLLAALLTGRALVATGLLPIPDETRRMGCLDGLRGYLALMVAVHHFVIWQGVLRGEGWHQPDAAIFNNFGQTGVALFFMASGALFYAKIKREGLSADWGALYLSRLFRIVPLMWLATALVLAVVRMRGGVPQPGDALALLKWLTFVKNPDLMGYPHTSSIIAHVVWSLRYEWVFYFGLPVLALLLTLTRRWLPDLAVVAAGTAVLLLLPGRVGPFGFVLIAFFGLGMIGYEVSRMERLRQRLAGPVAAAAGLAALAAQMTFWPTAFGPVQGILLAVFFIPVLAGNSYFGLLSRIGSVALGEVSYGIYLLHGIVLSVWMLDLSPRIAGEAGARWIFLPPMLVVVTLLASATFLLLERPMIAVGRRLARRRPARRLDA